MPWKTTTEKHLVAELAHNKRLRWVLCFTLQSRYANQAKHPFKNETIECKLCGQALDIIYSDPQPSEPWQARDEKFRSIENRTWSNKSLVIIPHLHNHVFLQCWGPTQKWWADPNYETRGPGESQAFGLAGTAATVCLEGMPLSFPKIHWSYCCQPKPSWHETWRVPLCTYLSCQWLSAPLREGLLSLFGTPPTPSRQQNDVFTSPLKGPLF